MWTPSETDEAANSIPASGGPEMEALGGGFGHINRPHRQKNQVSISPELASNIRLLDSRDPRALLVLQSLYCKPKARRLRQTKVIPCGADRDEIKAREFAKFFRGYGVNVETFELLRAVIG
jgi:hypothetical protein